MNKSNFSPLILSGPSGSGKSELIDYAENKNNIFCDAPGVTTRIRREFETGNIDCISESAFRELLKNDMLLQHSQFNGNYYGILKESLELLRSKQLVFNVGLNGAKAIQKIRPDSTLVYLLPPTKEELLRRMGDRDYNRYLLGITQTYESIDVYDYLLISYTDNIEQIYMDFVDIAEKNENSKVKSLKRKCNKEFMKKYYD